MNLKLPFFVCLIVMFSFTSARTQTGSWKRYTVPGQGFSVALPTLPAMSYYAPTENSRGWVMIGAYADGVVYALEVFENKRQQESLAHFIVEPTAQAKIDAATLKQISVNGVAGREYATNGPGKLQFFATQLRLYRFSVFGVTGDDPQAQRFFASIAFSEKEDGIAISEGPGTPYHADTDEAPYVGKDVETRIRLGMKPEPQYTDAARRQQIIGRVVLKAVFTSAGNVSNIRIISRLPYGLTERAVAAAQKIKFIPAAKDGHYVSMWIQLEYNFNLY